MLPSQGFMRVADQIHSDGRPMLVFGMSDGIDIEADFAHVRWMVVAVEARVWQRGWSHWWGPGYRAAPFTWITSRVSDH
jgi:hypothetical protein